MYLCVVRHGHAVAGSPDSQRPLSDSGRKQCSATAHWLADFTGSLHSDLIVRVSPYLRAQQSADELVSVLTHKGFSIDRSEWSMITPDDDVRSVIDQLCLEEWQGMKVLVSHMPLVGRLIEQLVDGRSSGMLGLSTGEAVILESDVWASGCARLVTRSTSTGY